MPLLDLSLPRISPLAAVLALAAYALPMLLILLALRRASAARHEITTARHDFKLHVRELQDRSQDQAAAHRNLIGRVDRLENRDRQPQGPLSGGVGLFDQQD